MSKPDNHIDELGAILDELGATIYYGKADDYKDFGSSLEHAKRQIEDFYRNKIPEKSTLKKHIKPNRQIGVPYLSEYDEGFNAAIRRITAQFNSIGDGDE